MKGKVALVTGAARGIGLAIATRLAEEGADVLMTDILTDAGEAAAARLQESVSGRIRFRRQDVTRDSEWEDAVAYAVSELGGLDCLVNNAGIETAALIENLTEADLTNILNINVIGVMLGTKHAFRAMKPEGPAGRGGAIVNIASAAAIMQGAGLSAYSVTKAGVAHFTRNAATEAGALRYNIRSNCIMPGMTETQMATQLGDHFTAMGLVPSEGEMRQDVNARVPLHRYADTSEIASVALFLLSDQSSYMTGACLPVEGGYSLI